MGNECCKPIVEWFAGSAERQGLKDRLPDDKSTITKQPQQPPWPLPEPDEKKKITKKPQRLVKREIKFEPDHGWKFPSTEYNGSYTFDDRPQKVEVHGTINEGIKEVKAHPELYDGLLYQTNMKDWPEDQQNYTLVKRTGSGFAVREQPNGGWTWVKVKYQALRPNVDVDPDEYTEKMGDVWGYQRQRLGKPLLPGRGQGCADVPSLKIIGQCEPFDVSQGDVGDCWLLSAISGLAEFEGAIEVLFRKTDWKNMPRDDFNHYTITLFDLATWEEVDIVVDERLCSKPDGSGLLGTKPTVDGELWVCYLEKAIAAHCGGWDKINRGEPTHGWAILTGCKEQYEIKNNNGDGFTCWGKKKREHWRVGAIGQFTS
jgi:hypothetical protein